MGLISARGASSSTRGGRGAEPRATARSPGQSRALCRKGASRDDRLYRLASYVRHGLARPLGDPFELVSLLGGEAHRYHKANRTPHFDIGDLRAEFNVARFDPLIAQCFVVHIPDALYVAYLARSPRPASKAVA